MVANIVFMITVSLLYSNVGFELTKWGACTKAGESPLQGDCGEFDSLHLHTSNIGQSVVQSGKI